MKLRPRQASAPSSQAARHNPSRAAKARVEAYMNISDLSSSPESSMSDSQLEPESESDEDNHRRSTRPSRNPSTIVVAATRRVTRSS